MSKTFILNIDNLKTNDDIKRIQQHFDTIVGIENLDIDTNLSIVSIRYNENVGSPNSILESFETLGYPVL